jgi:hypothetical protein
MQPKQQTKTKPKQNQKKPKQCPIRAPKQRKMQPRIEAALSPHHLLQDQHTPLRHLTKCYKKRTREGE